MKIKTALLSVTALATLSACADLGFGDLPLAQVDENNAGPVLISDLEPTVMASTQPSSGPFPVETTPVALPSAPTLPPVRTAAVTPRPAPAATPAPAAVAAASTMPKPAPAAAAPKPAPGSNQCFATLTYPAKTQKQTRQVLVSSATVKKETVPATYKSVTERVLVSPATTRTERVPATYKTVKRQVPTANQADGDGELETVTERVLVTPETTRTVEVPAKYDSVTERVKVKDSFTEWVQADKVYAIGAEAEGGTILANQVSSNGVMVLVEFPAEFKTETKRVLVEEATTREEVVPAVYETVTKRVAASGSNSSGSETQEVEVRVIDQPATTRTVPVPAVYKTETRRVIDTPAIEREVPVPAIYREEVTEREVSPARSERKQVVCGSALNQNVIRDLQSALKSRGIYDGAVDGLSGPATRRAITKFQNGAGPQLTMDSAKTLGLSL